MAGRRLSSPVMMKSPLKISDCIVGTRKSKREDFGLKVQNSDKGLKKRDYIYIYDATKSKSALKDSSRLPPLLIIFFTNLYIIKIYRHRHKRSTINRIRICVEF